MQALAFDRFGMRDALDEDSIFHLNLVHHPVRAALPRSIETGVVIGLHMGLWKPTELSALAVIQGTSRIRFCPGAPHIDLPTILSFRRFLETLGQARAESSEAPRAGTWSGDFACVWWGFPPIGGSRFTILQHLASRKLRSPHTRRTSQPQPTHTPCIVT